MHGGVFGELLEGHDFSFGAAGIMEEFSDEFTIMLDYDRKRTPRLLFLFSLFRMCKLRTLFVRDDKTKKGWHRTIKLSSPLPRLAIIAIQALLGSDSRREALNLMRVMRTLRGGMSDFQSRRWNILYASKLR